MRCGADRAGVSVALQPIDPGEIEKAVSRLAPYLGSIAKVVAKKQISEGRGLQLVHLEPLLARESGEFGSRHRSGYVVTLYLMAPDRLQNLQLFRGFHAFRHQSQIQGFSHADDGG